MPLPIFVVDAFTDRPFTGNPAAVCLLDAPQDESWLQGVAAEMNLSETAFLLPQDGHFRLRWFTPAVEVSLCGHATLASAHVLWQERLLPAEATAHFDTLSGRLSATRLEEGIALDFPASPVDAVPLTPDLAQALDAAPRWAGRSAEDLLVELADADAVRRLRPDLAALAQLPFRGIIATARAEPDRNADFVSRFFGPAVGVPEDPVTGSAHCALGPYWAERLGRLRLVGHQLSARGGEVRVEVRGSRVVLEGQARTVLRGWLEL